MLNKKHGVWVAYCRFEHTLGIVRSGRHNNFEAGYMRIPGLQHLRVLGPALCSSTAGHSHNKRYFRLTAEHVTKFGSLIDDLIRSKQAEIDGHQYEDRM